MAPGWTKHLSFEPLEDILGCFGQRGGPGTAKTSCPCSSASRAVISDPDLRAASTTSTPADKPEMIRLRLESVLPSVAFRWPDRYHGLSRRYGPAVPSLRAVRQSIPPATAQWSRLRVRPDAPRRQRAGEPRHDYSPRSRDRWPFPA